MAFRKFCKFVLMIGILPFLTGARYQDVSTYALKARSSKLSGLSQLEIQRDLTLFSPKDQRAIDTMARTIFGEARGEQTDHAVLAIAHVILNRVEHKKWPSDAAAVSKQRLQFSCWNKNDPNCALIKRVTLRNKNFRRAYRAAINAMLRKEDPTNGANHYHSVYMKRKPKWARCKYVTSVGRFGNHLFYKV